MRKLIGLSVLLVIWSVQICFAQVREIKGAVNDKSDRSPLPGVSVVVKGTTTGTATDAYGRFTLQTDANATLVFTFVGMKTREIALNGLTSVNVEMEADAEQMEEVVVLGYGTGRKVSSITGSVAKVNEEKFEKIATPNFTDALSGQVSGLSVLSASGDPSKAASIRLRGINTITASSEPLYVLDGAPISSSVFNTLNPSDIENILVLKDASSTAIYGSRAANGVILITSKKGKLGQEAQITIKAQYGFSRMVQDQADMMNSTQYIQFRDLIGQPVSQGIKDLVNTYGISTDWRKEIFSNDAPTYTLDARISGGNDKTAYYLSLNHHEQEGIISQSGMRRESLRASIDSRVKKWLKVGLQTHLGFTQYEQNNEIEEMYVDGGDLYATNPAFFSRIALPYDAARYYSFDENDNIVWGDKATHLLFSGFSTPEFEASTRDIQRKRVTGNLNFYQELTPIAGLTIRAQQVLDAFDYTLSNTWFPYATSTTPMGQTVQGETGFRQERFERYYSFTYTNTAEYKFNIDLLHNISVLAGQESIITKTNSFSAGVDGHTDSRQMRLQDGVTVGIGDLTHSITEEVFNSYFFTAAYNYNEKYYVDLSFRGDGSSKFAPGHRRANFFSASAMWNAKRESFLQDVTWLDDLSLKVGYGETGNSGIGNYKFFGLIGTGTPYNGSASLSISQASNEDLTWETLASTNIAVSFRLFDRVSANVEYYRKKTTDMLMVIPYSYTTGFGSGNGNIGAMTNRGVDLELSVDLLKNSDFFWNVKANFNYNKNRITELFNGRDEYVVPNTGIKYTVGHDVGEFYQVRYAGVDPRDGKQLWYDKDGNLTKTFNEERDAVLVGKSRYAPYSGGFGTQAGWKGLTLSADFAWQAKKYMTNNDNYFIENADQGVGINQSTRMLNIWTHPGQITDIPAYGEAIQFDDRLLEDASFLRLKNVTLQYNLPQSLLERTRLVKSASLFVVGRNLLTFTKYTGYDPEPDSNLSMALYPNTRQYVFGIEVTF